MQEKLKEIINSYPEFSRETVYNIVNEFNTKTLEEKKNQNREEILESFTVFGNNKIYLFEKTVKKCKMLIISPKEDDVLLRYKEIFNDMETPKRNFSKAFELFEDETRWYSAIDIELSEKTKESNLDFDFYLSFCIKKDFLEFFLFKNIMLYLSKESLVALDFVKALNEVEKYNAAIEIPKVFLKNSDFFQHGTMFSMLNKKTGFKKTRKYKKLPLSLLVCPLLCDGLQDLEFIFDDIIKNKEMYLNANQVFFFTLTYWGGFVMAFLKVNKITEKWNIFPEKYFDEGETENKEKIDVIYDIFNILDELEEKNTIKKLVNKKSFEAVEKMKEQLTQKLIAKQMKTSKPQKFKINAEFKELEKTLKEHFPTIEMIKEEQHLFLEGFEQRNCVYDYKARMKDNVEIIFSLKVKKEKNESDSKIPCGRYTISIKKIENADNYHFKVTEVRKKTNISDEDTKIVSEKISKVIENYNKNLSEAKLEKINCFIKNIEDFSSKEKIYNFFNAIKKHVDLCKSKENILIFSESNFGRKVEAEIFKDKLNINFFLERSIEDEKNNKKIFEDEIQISFSLKKDGETFFKIENNKSTYYGETFLSMINFIFDFFSEIKMMKDIKNICEEIMEERKKGYSPCFFSLPCLSYEESINYDSFISYILSRKEMKKTNFKRKDIENLMDNKYAKFFICDFLFVGSKINETAKEEKIQFKAEFLEKYLKHSENFQQLLDDFYGFPSTLAQLERQYFEVSGKLKEMGISFEDEDYLNREYFEKLIKNIQENSKKIRERNLNLKDLEFSFEGFEDEDKELFIENLIFKQYRIYEATKNFSQIEQFEALNKDLAFLANKELLEQAQNIPLENSGTVNEFLKNSKNEEAKLLKIIKTEKEYIENCLILNIKPEIERANKAENVISIWQVKDTKIKVMLESSLKDNGNKINFELKNPLEKINNEIISCFENESEKFFLEKEILSKLKERNEENETELEIPKWFEIFIERYLPNHLAIKNSKILSWASQKFKNNSYETFKSGNFKNRSCSFSNESFWEFTYNENGITDIMCSRIGEKSFSLRKEHPELLEKVQKFYKKLIEEMKENK